MYVFFVYLFFCVNFYYSKKKIYLAVTCDENIDTPESVVVNSNYRINYWLIVVALLAIACFLVVVAIITKYYIKHELTIPCQLV